MGARITGERSVACSPRAPSHVSWVDPQLHRESIHHVANNAIEMGSFKHSPLEYGVV